MKKDEILNASRKEHRNKDLAEMEVAEKYNVNSHILHFRYAILLHCL